MTTASRRRVLAAVLALVALPPLVALVEAGSFHLRNRNNGRLVSSGEEREYLLYLPESYDPATPTPLVLSLHGGAGWPALQRDLSGWNRLADRHGFIVAYPAGVERSGTRAWRVVRPGPGTDKDVRFLADLLDEIGSTYAIDRERTYVNGLSNGGGMTFVLSCALADRIAAVGTVAAAHMLPFDSCEVDRPMPLINFHGTEDRIVPYGGGETWVAPVVFPDVEQWTAAWARRNRCAPDPVATRVAADVDRMDYRGCADDTEVVLYTIHGGGHTWPGGEPLPEWFLGPTSYGVDATALMWEFFSRHSLAGGSASARGLPVDGELPAAGIRPPDGS
jgi:polyhydroxybutyrate depolymerase